MLDRYFYIEYRDSKKLMKKVVQGVIFFNILKFALQKKICHQTVLFGPKIRNFLSNETPFK
jgi:hypothetical protein